ncbi:DUF6199 family natural product biosynthesis protein [Mycobacterium sp. DL99]|uniref:DUF6199 family natural product biosynthesis protein n=1 Tax=Mycobacterium sp. DL99 TaxID=2528957 RepID=UPI001080867F|nr:DUF6199 family natural product biosynthesis protein [Mycobacterium sp. DL99]
MLGLGILSFLLAAVLVFFAMRPKLAFYLDEGWKFRNETEPSDTYVAVNGAGRIIGAVVAVVVGIACIGEYFSEKSEARAEKEQADLYAAAEQRCDSEVRPRFNEAIRWADDGHIANPEELQALAEELDVEIKITAGSAPSLKGKPPSRPDNLLVTDPTLPKYHDMLVYYSGLPSYLRLMADPVECSVAPPR